MNWWMRSAAAAAMGVGFMLAACDDVPRAPKLKAAVLPQLCSTPSLASCAPFGTWLVVDQSVRPTVPTHGGSWATSQFLFWIYDADRILGQDETAQMQFHGIQYFTQPIHVAPGELPPGPTGSEFGLVPESVFHTPTTNDVEVGAHLPAYGNSYSSGELPDYFWNVTVTIDAGTFKNIGIQAGTVGSCENHHITAWPSRTAVSLTVKNEMADATHAPCVVKFRLCAAKDLPMFQPNDSCSLYPGIDAIEQYPKPMGGVTLKLPDPSSGTAVRRP